MIEAYLDETGIHDGSAFCLIAGYFGGKGQWRRFEKDWRRVLTDFGVELSDFHALDLLNGRKAFYGFKERDRLLDRLTDVISSHRKIHPLSVGVVVHDFLSLPLLQRRFFTGATAIKGKLKSSGCPNKPYFLPFQACTRIAASYASVGGKVHFFCGLDRPFAEYATVLYRIIKTSGRSDPSRPRLGDIRFPLARETPTLQAADLLAYLTAQKIIDDGPGTAASGWLKKCLTNTRMPTDHVYYDARALRESLKEANERFGGFEGSELSIDFEREEEDSLPR